MQYIKNPFFMRYLLTYGEEKVPLEVENENGEPAFFLLARFTDDEMFQKVFIDIIKERPRLNLNYTSTQSNSTLFDLLLTKSPTLHKLNLLLDFGFDPLSEHLLYQRVIRTLYNVTTCPLEEKKAIVRRVVRVTEVKRQLEFIKVYHGVR